MIMPSGKPETSNKSPDSTATVQEELGRSLAATEKLEIVAKLFAIGAVVIYATGFLVVSIFLDRFGVREAGVEFLKVKYVQVGLLCVSFPFGILAPLFLFFYVRDHPNTKIPMPRIAIFGITNSLLVCYWFAVFANPGYFYKRGEFIGLLFLWIISAALFSRRFATGRESQIKWVDNIGKLFDLLYALSVWRPFLKRFRKPKTRTFLIKWLRRLKKCRPDAVRLIAFAGYVLIDYFISTTFFCIVVLCTGTIFAALCAWRLLTKECSKSPVIEYVTVKSILSFFKKMTQRSFIIALFVFAVAVDVDFFIIRALKINWEILYHVRFYYFYWVLAGLYLWREHKDMPDRYHNKASVAAWILGFFVVGTLYYMALLGFAYGVYPHIPAAKGGGDYARTPDVEFYWKSDLSLSLPTNLVATANRPNNSQSNSIIKSVRLKIIEETTSDIFVAIPTDQGGPTNWSSWHTPQVTALQRGAIMSAVYWQYKNIPTNQALSVSP